MKRANVKPVKTGKKVPLFDAVILFVFAIFCTGMQIDSNNRLIDIKSQGVGVSATVVDIYLKSRNITATIVEFDTQAGEHIRAELTFGTRKYDVGETLAVLYDANDTTTVIPTDASSGQIFYVAAVIFGIMAALTTLFWWTDTRL